MAHITGKLSKAVLPVLIGAALVLAASPQTIASERVTFLMDFVFGGKMVPFFVARDKGFFEKKGLDVTILKGRGSAWSATAVDANRVEYSYGDYLTAIKVMSKGGKNRAIGVGQVFQGGGFIFLDGSGIKTPKDLEGKRFGTTPAGFGNVLLPAMAAASGFDHTRIIKKTMKPPVRTPSLFEGKIDFFSGTRGGSIPRMEIVAARQGRKAGHLSFRDMGIQTYGHVIQTHEDRIEQNPDQVKKFLAAVFDAWVWSLENPKEALEVFLTANPELDREISHAQMVQGLSDVQDPETRKLGLGYMNESMVQKSVEIANKYFGLSPAVDYRTTYTNQFIQENPRM